MLLQRVRVTDVDPQLDGIEVLNPQECIEGERCLSSGC